MLPEQIYEKANESVVMIVTYDFNGNQLTSGSGVVISEDGRIISNTHLFEECESFEIRKGGIIISEVDVFDLYSEFDLILLKVKPGIFKSLILAQPDDIKIGKEVFSIGNPLGYFENSFSEGIINGLSKNEMNDIVYIQFTAPISPGNSGGVLLNEECELVGVNTSSITEGNDIYFTIPSIKINNNFKEENLYYNGASKYYLFACNALSVLNCKKSIEYFDKFSNLAPDLYYI